MELAKKYLNCALEALVKLNPPPLQQMVSIAQTLADLYDFTQDIGRADNMVKWLGQATSTDAFKGIRTGRMSEAVDWCLNHGFSGTRFDVKDAAKGFSALEYAIRQEDHDKLETLLIFTERTTPSTTLTSRLLLTAAEMRSLRACQLLFDHKAGVDAIDENGKTVLHRCQHCPKPGNEDGPKIAGLFLSKDRELLDKKDATGKTALYMACEAGSGEMVQFLLKSGAKPNMTEINSKSPLYLACERGDRRVVKCLLSKAQNLDLNTRGPGGFTPLIVAVKFAATHAEGIGLVQALLNKGADPTIEDNTKKSAINYAGGVWASELRRALKSGSLKPSMSAAIAPEAGSSHSGPYQRSIHRSGSTVSKLGHMVSSATPSFLSRSRTSFAPSSKPMSTFSRDLGSRRTSWTAATDYSSQPDVTVGGAAGEIFGEEHYSKGPGPEQASGPPQPSPRDLSDDPEILSPKGKDAERPGRVTEMGQGPGPSNKFYYDAPGASDDLSEHSSESSTDIDPLEPEPTGDDDDENESNSQSTEFATETPSGSSGDSYFGDDATIHHQMEHLALGPSEGAVTDRPSGSNGPRRVSQNDQSFLPAGSSSRGQAGPVKRLGKSTTSNAGRDKKRVNTSMKTRAMKTRQRLLACPFAKHDPFTYARCNHHELTKIRFVKQHITRYHQQPPYCVRCMHEFSDDQERDEHMRTISCPVVSHEPPDGITTQQQIELSRKSDAALNEAAQWNAVFRIIFPNSPLPDSPYRDELVNMSVYNQLLMQYVRNQVPEMVAGAMRHRGNSPLGYEEVVEMVGRGMLEFRSHVIEHSQGGLELVSSQPSQAQIPLSGPVQQREMSSAPGPSHGNMFPLNNPLDQHQHQWATGHSPESVGAMSLDGPESWQQQQPLAPITELSSSESPGGSNGHNEPYMAPFPVPAMTPDLSDPLMHTQQPWYSQAPDSTFLAGVGWGMQAMPDPESPHDSWLNPTIESVQRDMARGLLDVDRAINYVPSDHSRTPPSQQ
jgi:hypothetical protein